MFQNFYLGYLRLQNSLNKSTQYKIRCGETRLAHVLQRFVSINFLLKAGLLEIYALNSLIIPDQIHHCMRAEPV